MRTDRPRIHAMLLAALGAVAFGTAGCAAAAPEPGASASARPSGPATTSSASMPTSTPSATSGALLTCADLATPAEIAAAFTSSRSSAPATPGPVAAADSTPLDVGTITGGLAVQGAGGLACAWTVGSAGTYSVQVLPRSTGEWSALMYGDGPTADRRTFAGVSAAATCGDPGCGASALVGSTWVRVDLIIEGYSGAHSAVGPETDEQILAGADPAISHAFEAVQGAGTDRLRFPVHPGGAVRDGTCASFLTAAGLATALGSGSATWQQRHPDGASESIEGAAQHRSGTVDCFGDGSGTTGASTIDLLIAPGQAWAVRSIAADPPSGFAPIRLHGQASDETALTDCARGGSACEVLFTLGSTAIQVDDGTRSVQVAEAVLAQAR